MENKEKDPNRKPSKNLPLILIGLVVLIAIIIIAVMMNKGQQGTNNPAGQTGTQTGQVDQATGQTGEGDTDTPTNAAISLDDENLQTVVVPGAGEAKVVIPGANPITADNKVVTETGQITENSGVTMGENAPKQTGFLNKEELPDDLVKLNVGTDKFTPNSFTTVAGAPTTFSLTGVDEYSHVIAFDDPSLSAIAILVGPGQTKAITFNAPETPGTYTFRCASPGHADKGEVGEMIVQ